MFLNNNKTIKKSALLREGHNDVWGITIGLLLTTVSLVWTGWSYTADTRLANVDSVQSAKAVTPTASNADDTEGQLNLDVPLMDGEGMFCFWTFYFF